MIKPLAFTFALLIATVAFSNSAVAEQRLYLSAGGKVTLFAVDEATGELEALQEQAVPGAGPLCFSPSKDFLYATATQQTDRGRVSAIATFAVDKTGMLEPVARAPVNMGPVYLSTDATGQFLSGAHYFEGQVSIWKLDEGAFRGGTVQELELELNAHSTIFSPDNRWLLTPATGPNKVFQLRFDAERGTLSPNDPASASGPTSDGEAQQPRHLIFHPDKPLAYTTLERERPGVGVWTWNTDDGALSVIQNIVSYPPDFSGVITTADLHLTPDNRFLYISNRDITDRQARTGNDSIVGFSVDAETGKLTMLGHTKCEHVPRSFAIDETGNFLYVAGQGEDRLGVYRIDKESGSLTKVTAYDTGARPSWVLCVTPPGGSDE